MTSDLGRRIDRAVHIDGHLSLHVSGGRCLGWHIIGKQEHIKAHGFDRGEGVEAARSSNIDDSDPRSPVIAKGRRKETQVLGRKR